VVEAGQAEHAVLLARGAVLERLVRAVETRTLVQMLARKGGADWDGYAALVAVRALCAGGVRPDEHVALVRRILAG
jgi:hypothetical protein